MALSKTIIAEYKQLRDAYLTLRDKGHDRHDAAPHHALACAKVRERLQQFTDKHGIYGDPEPHDLEEDDEGSHGQPPWWGAEQGPTDEDEDF